MLNVPSIYLRIPYCDIRISDNFAAVRYFCQHVARKTLSMKQGKCANS